MGQIWPADRMLPTPGIEHVWATSLFSEPGIGKWSGLQAKLTHFYVKLTLFYRSLTKLPVVFLQLLKIQSKF